jgi:ribosomal protein S18
MTRQKKITVKQATQLSNDVQEFLKSVGATEVEDVLGYGMHLETTLGTLKIIVPTPESNAKSTIASVFARFEEPKRASSRLHLKTCNPYSGKWNFHEYTTERCLESFIDHVTKILPEGVTQ